MSEVSRPFPSSTWRAVLARLIPTDEAPGALEAGVDHRLEAQGHAPNFHEWLLSLDQAAGGNFAGLDDDAQDHLLQQVERGNEPAVSGALFTDLVSLTAEAFYSNPDDLTPDRTTPAWQMLGYTPRPLAQPSSASTDE
jgi:hypothetical protein